MNKIYLQYRDTLLANSKRYYKNNSDKVKIYQQNKRTRYKLERKCIVCGKKLSINEKYRCAICKKKHNLDSQRRFKELADKGLCRVCLQPIGKSNAKYFCQICHQKQLKRRVEGTKILKKKAIDFLGSKCYRCGLKTEKLVVYDFHHINPNEKEAEMRNLLFTNWELLKIELKKCELVCSNCHRIIHFDRIL